MNLSSSDASIVVAVLSLIGVMASLAWTTAQGKKLAALNDELSRRRDAETKAQQAENLVARYRDPLLEAAFDLQSRLFNALRQGATFRWGPDDGYFMPSTLFLFGQFFGWVEILRQDMLYSDIANIGDARQLLIKIRAIQSLFSSTTGPYRDARRIYRVEQRAIGEIMIDAVPETAERHFYKTIGYATFMRKLDDDQFSKWFAPLVSGLDSPPPPDQPDRLRAIQRALIELVDFLDPDSERFPGNRTPLPGDRRSEARRGSAL